MLGAAPCGRRSLHRQFDHPALARNDGAGAALQFPVQADDHDRIVDRETSPRKTRGTHDLFSCPRVRNDAFRPGGPAVEPFIRLKIADGRIKREPAAAQML